MEVRKDEGEYLDPAMAKITLRQFWPKFLEASPHLRPSTLVLYTGHAEKHLLPALGDRRLSAITSLDISAFIASQQQAGVGDATVRASFRLLRTILNRAVLGNLIGRNPAIGVKVGPAPRREMLFASAEQVANLASAAPRRYEALIYLLAYGGLRIGEAVALDVADLDLLRGRVEISKTVSEVAERLQVGPTKTGATRRISLPTFLQQMLAHHIELEHTAADGSLFSAPEGGPVRPRNFRGRVFEPARRAAGLADGFRIHDLRHTCAALLIAQGAHAKEIAERFGHSSPVVTMSVYAHILPRLDQRLTSGLEEKFKEAMARRTA